MGFRDGSEVKNLPANVYVRAKSLQSCLALCDPKTVVHQPPLSMRFSRQEYWSGLLFPSPGNLPDSGIEPTSLMPPALAGGFFATSATWDAPRDHCCCCCC